MSEYIALGILVIAFGAQIVGSFGVLPDVILRRSRRISWLTRSFALLRMTSLSKGIYYLSILIVFGFSLFLSIAQYFVWKEAGPPSSYFLPPYQSIWYWVQYSLQHFWLSYVISLGISLLFFVSAKFLNKKFNERFFYEEEYYIGALSIFLSGQPGWILYLIFLFLVTVPLAGFFSFIFKKRLSFYYLWIPLSVLTILVSKLEFVQRTWDVF